MQITIRRDGTKVEAKISIHVPTHNSVTYTMRWEAESEFYAGFLAQAMQMQMNEEMQKARREAYEQGWKDAKSKKVPKQNWFSSIFGTRA